MGVQEQSLIGRREVVLGITHGVHGLAARLNVSLPRQKSQCVQN
jgi:hypothetical protein